MNAFRSLPLILLIALLLAACDSGPGSPPPPEEVGADVESYLQDLPNWDEFAPSKANQDPTPAGEPVEEEPVTLDVEEVDENGDVYTEENVVYSCQTQPYTLTQNPEQIAMYSPDREILWAGSLIQGKSHRDDLVWNHLGSTNQVAVALANDDGTFAAPTTFAHPEAAPEGWGKYTLVTGDLNGDDRTDLVWNVLEGLNFTYFGFSNGDGTFVMPTYQSLGIDGTQNTLIARLADVNADGRDDIVVYNQTLDETHVGLGTTGGTFDFSRTPQKRPQQDDWSQFQFLVGDFNGDRHQDALWNDGSARNRVYVGLARTEEALALEALAP